MAMLWFGRIRTMAKVSAAHQASIDCLQAEQREKLAYHHILTAIVRGTGKWGQLQRVGSAYHQGDSWVWQLAFTPRMRDAVIMETFKSRVNGEESVRCFYLADAARQFDGRSFDSSDSMRKLQALYFHAVEMERIEQNRAA